MLSVVAMHDSPPDSVVIIAFVVVFMNYLADIITQYVDPRVRLS